MLTVFCISGPDRAVDASIEAITSLRHTCDFAIMVHLWESENLTSERIAEIRKHDRVKQVMVSPDLESRGFRLQLENLQVPGSSAVTKNMVSMFWGVHEVLEVAMKHFPEATHLVRIRSDLMLRQDSIRFPLGHKLVVSKSANIPISWPSDHFMAGPSDVMIDIWHQHSIPELIEEFVLAKKNAEYLLFLRLREANRKLGRKARIYRFIDYEIIRLHPFRGDMDRWLEFPSTALRYCFDRSRIRPLLIFFSLLSSLKHELAFRVRRIP